MVAKRNVFLSHSSTARPVVERVAQELREMGLEPWFYEQDISPGRSIPRELNEALARADYFLLFWSGAALNSRWVQAEFDAAFFERADKESVLIVPLLLDDTELPPLLKPISYVDFRRSVADGIARLRTFFGREGFGPERPPRLLQPGPSCEDKLAAHRNMELRQLLKSRLSLNDVREMWMDTFNSILDNELPGMPLGVVIGEMILRADQRRARGDLIQSICANRPDLARN
jgi:hypothetical protein